MDTDSGGYFTSNTLFKTSLLTIAFSTFYVYKTEKRFPFFKQTVVSKAIVPEVKPKTIVVKKKTKTIYLTFDDGPNKGTRKLIDIINAEQVPATVFLIGEHVYGSSEQKDIYDSLVNNDLFEIANHSYTHAFENKYQQFYNDPDSMVKDFERCADSLQLNTHIVRTPGRNIWRTANISSTDLSASKEAADSLREKGFTAIGWDLEWHFTPNQQLVQSDTLLLHQVDSLFAHNKMKTLNKLILLAHDRTFLTSADSSKLHRFIIALKKTDEYNFETISQYTAATN